MKAYNENGLVTETSKGYKSIQVIKATGSIGNLQRTKNVSINPVNYDKTDIEVQCTLGRVTPQGSSSMTFYKAYAELALNGSALTIITPASLNHGVHGFTNNYPPYVTVRIKERY